MFLSLVIPCYNEEESIPPLLAGARRRRSPSSRRRGHAVEVMLVDDGSRDEIARAAASATAGAPVAARASASRATSARPRRWPPASTRARGDVIVPIDGDLQNDPADIPLLLAKLDEGYDVVSGWRKDRQDTAVTRKLPSLVANRLISRDLGRARCTTTAARSRPIAATCSRRAPLRRDAPLHPDLRRVAGRAGHRDAGAPPPARRTARPSTASAACQGLARPVVVQFLWTLRHQADPLLRQVRPRVDSRSSFLAFVAAVYLKYSSGHKDFVADAAAAARRHVLPHRRACRS